jgi:two-component system, OmpR family, sensor histidine kinase CiaH
MLKKVKRRLVIYNAAVLAVIFLFFFGGTWVMMQQGFNAQSERFLMQIALAGQKDGPGSGLQGNPAAPDRFGSLDPLVTAGSTGTAGTSGSAASPDLPGGPRIPDEKDQRVSFQFDSDGKLLLVTSNHELTAAEQTELQAFAWKTEAKRGTFHVASGWFRYFVRSDDSGGKVVALVDINREKAVFSTLMNAYLVIGLAGLVLILLSSLFLTTRALVPIKEAWDKQVQFVGDASHELRTPLTVISTNLDVVTESREETVDSQMHWLSNIRRAYRRMDSLVSDLLFLAQADSGKPMTERRPFSLSRAATETAQQFDAVVLKRQMAFERNIPDDLHYLGDDARIRQLIAILLDNAIKYTADSGKISLSISCEPYHPDKESRKNTRFGACTLRVEDTGVGIPKEEQKRIFERFYRVDKARSRETGGNGMGLSIAACIAKEHGGSIGVESTPGRGSTFTVSLPARSAPRRFRRAQRAVS